MFGDRLRRHGVEIVSTAEFDSAIISGQPSAVLASFVNLTDNAIHWMQRVDESRRQIRLAVDGSGVTFANTGPAIEHRIADRIFEFGETNRVGGRGMGLYVSREALRRSNLNLTLEDLGGDLFGPTFRISPMETDETAETQA
ncbi:ATP-binding protein [Bosea sp. R86505]|uniref:ATP-binding protein n=1 Tax=Bosea sp. R86505 TaxID=3101710 RepID=UPI003670FED0